LTPLDIPTEAKLAVTAVILLIVFAIIAFVVSPLLPNSLLGDVTFYVIIAVCATCALYLLAYVLYFALSLWGLL
jgi:uncharacterized membrane protein